MSTIGESLIPVNEPRLGGREQEYVGECLKTGWISSAGSFIERFEAGWAAYCGMPYGVAVSNGTTALQIAVRALDIGPNDEVILPSFTIISCALAVVDAGATPVLVDCDPRTWCMNVAEAAAKVTPRTRAIMPVHMYGHPVDMEPLVGLARARGLHLIEDAAEAHGAEYKGRKAGGLGDVSTFSFFANKIITTGEGGMVLARSEQHAASLRALRNLCFRSDRRFFHTELGYNYRLTNVQAAIGVAQLERIDDHLRQKQWMARAYGERLRGLPQLELPVQEPWATNVYWMYGLVLSDDVPFDAVEFARRLKARGVETRPFFLGMHEQPVFHERGLFTAERYPVTERIARRGLYLPSGLTLTEEQVDRVCAAVKAVLA